MRELLTHLAENLAASGVGEWVWREWKVRRVEGGANNVLFRATSPGDDLAVKFTIRDARRRARREFQALAALQETGLAVAPEPLLLDEDGFSLPVVVQRWVAGPVTAVPPQTDAAWEALVAHYAAIHTVTPAAGIFSLEKAVVNFDSIAAAASAIQQQLDHIPPAARPSSLQRLLRQVMVPGQHSERFSFVVPATLCRVDANTLNFVRREEAWVSVDWENSGWGDPAFEIVDLMTHPQYRQVPAERWRWVMARYAAVTGDETAIFRIEAYYPLMLVWWVARLARMLYEVPRGLDERLIPRPAAWLSQTQAKYERYLARALVALNEKMPGAPGISW